MEQVEQIAVGRVLARTWLTWSRRRNEFKTPKSIFFFHFSKIYFILQFLIYTDEFIICNNAFHLYM